MHAPRALDVVPAQGHGTFICARAPIAVQQGRQAMDTGRKQFYDDGEPKLLRRSKPETAEPEENLEQVLDEDLELDLDED